MLKLRLSISFYLLQFKVVNGKESHPLISTITEKKNSIDTTSLQNLKKIELLTLSQQTK